MEIGEELKVRDGNMRRTGREDGNMRRTGREDGTIRRLGSRRW